MDRNLIIICGNPFAYEKWPPNHAPLDANGGALPSPTAPRTDFSKLNKMSELNLLFVKPSN